MSCPGEGAESGDLTFYTGYNPTAASRTGPPGAAADDVVCSWQVAKPLGLVGGFTGLIGSRQTI